MTGRATLELSAGSALHARPVPPAHLLGEWPYRFESAPEMAAWLRAVFIAPDGPFANDAHAHLLDAHIGVLWTNVALAHQQRNIVGQAEIPLPQGNRWRRERQLQQIGDWFDGVPDFLITFYAPVLATVSDRAFCAITEHELYHCAQALDDYGLPKFHADGSPWFGLRGHDVEEFVDIVRRWGVVDGNMRALVDAASRAPDVAAESIDAACGTCRARIA